MAALIQREMTFDTTAATPVHDGTGVALNRNLPAGTAVTFDDTTAGEMRVHNQVAYYHVTVGPGAAQAQATDDDWVRKARLAPRVESGGDTFRIETGVYKGAPTDLLAHVFLGIEDAEEHDVQTIEPYPTTPTGKMTWKGFYPTGGLEADNAEQLQQHVGVARAGGVEPDVNKARSSKARFETTQATPAERAKLVWWMNTHANDQYNLGQMGCIGFARAALRHEGLGDPINPTALGIADEAEFATDMYGAQENAYFEDDSIQWTKLQSKRRKRMQIAWSNQRGLLLAKEGDDGGGKRGVIRNEGISQVKRHNVGEDVKWYNFDTTARPPSFWFDRGKVIGPDRFNNGGYYPVIQTYPQR